MGGGLLFQILFAGSHALDILFLKKIHQTAEYGPSKCPQFGFLDYFSMSIPSASEIESLVSFAGSDSTEASSSALPLWGWG